VKCTQGTAQPFLVHGGLSQGCPLSTTLFNLGVYDLQAHLHRACPDAGVRLTRAGTTPPRMLTDDVGYLFIVTSAQLRSRCDVWLALKASLQTVHHVLHAASESGS
jgi:hypothetical protein